MSRIIILILQILLICTLCNCSKLRKGDSCVNHSECNTWLSCNSGVCDMCVNENVKCDPLNGLKCCDNLTCEVINGLKDNTYACRPNNNTCQTDKDCFSDTRPKMNRIANDLKCLSNIGNKCGMLCKETGKPCGIDPYYTNDAKCCGYCDLIKSGPGKDKYGHCKDFNAM